MPMSSTSHYCTLATYFFIVVKCSRLLERKGFLSIQYLLNLALFGFTVSQNYNFDLIYILTRTFCILLKYNVTKFAESYAKAVERVI